MPQIPLFFFNVRPERNWQVLLTGDEVHRDEDRSQRGKLGKHLVDLVVRVCHLNADLR